MGKGRRSQQGSGARQGDVTVIHDADLEYNPDDLRRLLVPFLHKGADVFGSRFRSADYRRVLYFRHSVGNKLLPGLCDIDPCDEPLVAG
jgi:hypothetical protein